MTQMQDSKTGWKKQTQSFDKIKLKFMEQNWQATKSEEARRDKEVPRTTEVQQLNSNWWGVGNMGGQKQTNWHLKEGNTLT